jgi:WD40 repeat protein
VALAAGFTIFVARQLRSTRGSLAAAFIDKAQAAEKDLDWGRAAAYHAASLVQRDSLLARWSLALDAQRMPRMTSRDVGPAEVGAVAFLSDARAVLLRSPGDGVVIAEAVDSGRELWRAMLPSAVSSFRPGGGVVSAFYQNTERWRAYDLASGQPVADGPEYDSSPCLGAPGAPRALWRAVPGGERLEAIRSQGPVVLRETRGSTQGKCVVSPDGRRLAAYVAEESSMMVWDLETLKPILRRPGPLGSPSFTRHGLAVPAEGSTEVLGGAEGDFAIPTGIDDSSPDWLIGAGRVVARVHTNRAGLMDLDERRMTAIVPVPDYPAVADDGSQLIVTSKARPEVVVSWSLPRPALGFRAASPAESQIAFSADGNSFAIASDPIGAPSPIEVWTREGKLAGTIAAPRLPATRFNLSADGSRLGVVSTASLAAVWDVATSTRLLEFECSECFSGIVPSGDGSLVLANSTRREVALWDVARRDRRWQLAMKEYVWPLVALSNDGELAARIYDFALIITATATRAVRTKIPLGRENPTAIAFSQNGKRIAAAGPKGVSVWSVDGAPGWSVRSTTLKASIGRVLWSTDDARLILGNDEASILDAATGELLVRISPEARSPQPRAFVSPDLRYVVRRTLTGWTLQPLPSPESGPPSLLLDRMLADSGLTLAGAELIALSPGASR